VSQLRAGYDHQRIFKVSMNCNYDQHYERSRRIIPDVKFWNVQACLLRRLHQGSTSDKEAVPQLQAVHDHQASPQDLHGLKAAL